MDHSNGISNDDLHGGILFNDSDQDSMGEDDHQTPDMADQQERSQISIRAATARFSKPLTLLKLPQFLAYQREPFDEAGYLPDVFRNLPALSSGPASFPFLAKNVIRVQKKDGRCNSRLVKWSNGTYSLQIGSELFDITSVPLSSAKSALFAANSSLLEFSGTAGQRFLVRPFSASNQAHKRYTRAIDQSNVRERKVKLSHTSQNPEQAKADIEKAEQERLRLLRKLEAKRRNVERMEYIRSARLTSSFLEDEEQLEEDHFRASRDDALRAAQDYDNTFDLSDLSDGSDFASDAFLVNSEGDEEPQQKASESEDDEMLFSSRLKAPK